MHVVPVPYDSAAWIELTGRDGPWDASSLGRWVVYDGDEAAGWTEARARPDGKVFLSIHAPGPDAQRLVIAAARRSLARPLHVICRPGRSPDRDVLLELGFETTLIEDVFSIDFSDARSAVERAWVPSGYSILGASMVDRDRLFDLDIRLRRLVPGTESWQGDRAMFDAELSESPPFDPGGYLVAVDEPVDELVGLVRFWRNEPKPRLGLIAVVPSRRATTVGPALLKQGLEAASTWGSDDFVTETSRANRHTHRRLMDLGARITGSFEILTG